jgi:hypothetical protein
LNRRIPIHRAGPPPRVRRQERQPEREQDRRDQDPVAEREVGTRVRLEHADREEPEERPLRGSEHERRAHAREAAAEVVVAEGVFELGVVERVSRVVGDLLTHDAERGPDNLSSIEVSPSLQGQRFVDALVELKETQAAIAVAVVGTDGSVDINPAAERALARGERLLAIMRER